MLVSSITDRNTTHALIKTMAFNEARFKTIANNVANSETPGYRTRQLDVGAFQRALGEALETRGRDRNARFDVRVKGQVLTRPDGTLKVTPQHKPVENILFHDGTNMSIERQMADLAETGMVHQFAAEMLRGGFDGLRKAIRGRIA